MVRSRVHPGRTIVTIAAVALAVGACSRNSQTSAPEVAEAAPAVASAGQVPPIPAAAPEAVELIPTGLEFPVGFEITDDSEFYVLGRESLVHIGSDGQVSERRQLDGIATALAVTSHDIVVAMTHGLGRIPRDDIHRKMALVAFSEGTMATGVAVNGGTVFVADSAGRRLLEVVRNEMLPVPLAGADGEGVRLVVPSPYLDVRVGEGKVLLVNNPGAHQILGLSPGGGLAYSWGAASSAVGGFCGCCGPISFDALPDGKVVTAEKGCRRVQLFGADGGWLSLVADAPAFAAADRICDLRGIDPTKRWLKVRGGTDGSIWVLERCTGDLLRFERETILRLPKEVLS